MISFTPKQAMYKDALTEVVLTTVPFNSEVSKLSNARLTTYIERIIFCLLFLGLTVIATLAVFARSGIDTWIQFSLYIVPLFAMICGHSIFKSHSFREILRRRVDDGLNAEENEIGTARGASESRVSFHEVWRFLRKRSVKTCLYPLCLVLYQWTVYLIFFRLHGNSEFSGPRDISDKFYLDKDEWLPLYYTFWTVGMYVTGFVGSCFILVVDIHKLDVKTFLCQFGKEPVVQTSSKNITDRKATDEATMGRAQHATPHAMPRAHKRGQGTVGASFSEELLYRVISPTVGFLSLGVIDLTPEPLSDNNSRTDNLASDSGITVCRTEAQVRQRRITPKEASELLNCLVMKLDNISSLFKPFLVLLTFFSVTNLVTHVVAMVVIRISGFTVLHMWTLARTLLWFLLAIRLLWAVAAITKSLSRIIPHVSYLRSVGELPGHKDEWANFFQLAQTFQLGSRAYGFPLTLKQVASIVALVNFSFLIALSFMSKEYR